jgi:ParB family transcriptional regulator, chromosome partitioning protein
MNKRRGLGRGLEALIPLQEDAVDGVDGTRSLSSALRVPIDAIRPNPDQPRRVIDPTSIRDLAESIRQHGILQPLLVRERADGYEVIAGERRLRAAQLAGLHEVPVVVHEALLAGVEERLELALVENLQREDLNAVEQARALHRLVHEFGMTQEAVATRLAKSRVAVTNAIRLLALPEPVLNAIEVGELTAGHGVAMLALPSAAQQLAALDLVVRERWSVRQTSDWVRAHQRAPRPLKTRARPSVDPDTLALEEEFRRALGTKVILSRFKDGGRLTIEFYSNEELEALRKRLTSD